VRVLKFTDGASFDCSACRQEDNPDVPGGLLGDRIKAAADELIRTGYANTNGLITLQALRYRIVGIIARHVLKDQADE